MYKRVLVTLDGSPLAEQALPYARLLSKGLGIPLVLFRAYNPMPDMAYPPSGAAWDRISDMMRDEAAGYLTRQAKLLRNGDVDATTAMEAGNPTDEIIQEAERQRTTLVVMTTHGRSGVARGILGSVATRVVNAGNIPVFLVKAKDKPASANSITLDTILVALDGSPLAEQALPHVNTLAKSLDLNVVLLNIHEQMHVEVDFIGRSKSPNEKSFREYEAKAAEYLEKLATKVKGQGVTKVEQRIEHGQPADVFADIARDLPNSFIAITTHGRSGLGRWIMGSVADRVVREANVPVLMTRVKK
ncbi:MAG: universal stress protein [Chloroflexi bacterium]|nr:universal stress protein [Chloroflexota bacterium]